MKPSHSHLQEVQKLWQLESADFRFIRYVENYVYEAFLKGRSVIVRFTEPSHRSLEQLKSELHWIDYLKTGGMSVASPISSLKGEFVEPIGEGTPFFCGVFEKAPGAPLEDDQAFTPIILKNWGRYVGNMHRLTQDYDPPSSIEKRPLWKNDSNYEFIKKGLDPKNKIPYEKFNQSIKWLEGLSRGRNEFGLIHGDLHYGNFFVKDNQITAFDFDDSAYNWFVYDLVTPLFHLWMKRDQGILEVPYEQLEESYLEGYHQIFKLEPIWLKRMPLFTQFRINTVYHWAKGAV